MIKTETKTLVKLSDWICNVDRNEIGGEIDSHELVEKLFESSDLNKLIEDNDDIWWTGDAEAYFEKELGFKIAASGNTYNHESDLSSIMQWSVMVPGNEKGDELYNDGIILIQFHHGGDARGNYGRVKVYKWHGEDSFSFLDTCVGWRFESGTDADGKDLDRNKLERMSEKYEIGYAQNPTYQLHGAIERVVSIDLESNNVTLLLKTGETVVAYPYHSAEYC